MYFDYASTSPLLDCVKKTLKDNFDNYGNPSNEYNIGVENKKRIDEVREKILERINAEGNIYFTSGGSESNTWAIIGTVLENDIKAIITSKIEHESVLNACDYLTSHGVEVLKIGVDEFGNFDEKEYRTHLKYCKKYGDKVLVSLMLVNNELGTIENISYFSKLAHSYGYIFHTDAVQALGHIVIDNEQICANLMSFSGHKIGSPKGIGALFVDNTVSLTPIIFGGKQEDGIRGGTENVLGILSLGASIDYYTNEKITENISEYNAICRYFKEELAKRKVNYYINNNVFEEQNCPNILSLTIHGVYGDSLAAYLEEKYNIQVGVGSACSYGIDVSHVLKAAKPDKTTLYNTIRVSFGEKTTLKDAKTLAIAISEGVKFLKKMKKTP